MVVRGQTIKVFEDVIFSLKEGEVSEVFSSEAGYHLVQVSEKTAARDLSYEDVHKNILQDLHHEKKNLHIGEFVDQLRKTVDIRIEAEPGKPEEPSVDRETSV